MQRFRRLPALSLRWQQNWGRWRKELGAVALPLAVAVSAIDLLGQAASKTAEISNAMLKPTTLREALRQSWQRLIPLAARQELM